MIAMLETVDDESSSKASSMNTYPKYPTNYNIKMFEEYVLQSSFFKHLDFNTNIWHQIHNPKKTMPFTFLQLCISLNSNIHKVSSQTQELINGSLVNVPQELKFMRVLGHSTIKHYAQSTFTCMEFFVKKLNVALPNNPTTFIGMLLFMIDMPNQHAVHLNEYIGNQSFIKPKHNLQTESVLVCKEDNDFDAVELNDLVDLEEEADDDDEEEEEEKTAAAANVQVAEIGNQELRFKSIDTIILHIRGILQVLKRVQAFELIQKDDQYIESRICAFKKSAFVHQLITTIAFLTGRHRAFCNGQSKIFCINNNGNQHIAFTDHPHVKINAATMQRLHQYNLQRLCDEFASIFKLINSTLQAESQTATQTKFKAMFPDVNLNDILAMHVLKLVDGAQRPVQASDSSGFVNKSLFDICQGIEIIDKQNALFFALIMYLTVRCGPAPRTRDWIGFCKYSLVVHGSCFFLVLNVQKNCSSIRKSKWMLDDRTAKFLGLYFAIFQKPIIDTIASNVDITKQMNISIKLNMQLFWMNMKWYRVIVSLFVTHFFGKMDISNALIETSLRQLSQQLGHTKATNDSASYSNCINGLADVDFEHLAHNWSTTILCIPFVPCETVSWRQSLHSLKANLVQEQVAKVISNFSIDKQNIFLTGVDQIVKTFANSSIVVIHLYVV
jgi:hypothetical protein